MSNGNSGTVAAFLKDHPRLAGVLFAALVALTQIGSASAAMAGTID
ncbi:hypothetical protein SAMN06269185_1111 [Natronoarchaeum philippinense]|uniref:Uncharacterized protein n=1 Tax=Natronoarchaeum philippinense TaxID=558529 RepID=A0A285N9U7_NATPI|nr:hypothetical protein [Natronoarchaeum philippinense]SNZ06274.1 hypothetical protein SAMN06269185_1111 [Natronoarchaeum philippinense]